jgi:O-methyltransferase
MILNLNFNLGRISRCGEVMPTLNNEQIKPTSRRHPRQDFRARPDRFAVAQHVDRSMNKRTYFTTALRSLRTYEKFKDATMIPRRSYIENLALAACTAETVDGAVIECGTWRGGMAAGLITAVGHNRNYYFFDSFEGLPEAKPIDGPAAIAYQANVDDPMYLDNCRASLHEFNQVIARTGIPLSRCSTIKGFFEKSLPELDLSKIGPIAILSLDADWYESIMICLRTFWDHVATGGIVLIDDYYAWDGCTLAVNEFFSGTSPPQRISRGPLGGVAYVVKRG